MPFIPHTKDELEEMLKLLKVNSISELFDEIPESLQYKGKMAIPDAMNEMEMLNHAAKLARKNRELTCFIGAGSYDHHIPAAVWDIASRGEFLTAYTPYQAEASQGTLQLLYEFQTMIAELTGMEVANASMYDGASALAEAVLMAARINKKKSKHRILVASTIHPSYLDTLHALTSNLNIEIETIEFDIKTGILDINNLNKYLTGEETAFVIAFPNFFGCLEEVDELTDWAHKNNLMVIGVVNPIACGLLKPPGLWGTRGADIVCGDGQPLGVPMAMGGPSFGFFSTRMEYVRQMPGRLVGKTTDSNGREGYALTLQAREQHIRRAKATSNICTNQGLLVTAATIHMSLLGPQGLEACAIKSHQNTHNLVERLTEIKGVQTVFSAPFFHEALIRFDRPLEIIEKALLDVNILPGFVVGKNSNTLLVCATEKRTESEISEYVDTIKQLAYRGVFHVCD